jgi:hypothetical protein
VAEWLFVFNSAAVHMNQDHRSAGEITERFNHPHPSNVRNRNVCFHPMN